MSPNDFKNLKKEWDLKLAASGFEDIEANDGQLKTWNRLRFTTQFFQRGTQFFEAKAEYYRIAGQFLYDHKFKNAREKLIWTLHAEGLSLREIAARIKATGVRINKDAINRTVSALKTVMLEKFKVTRDR